MVSGGSLGPGPLSRSYPRRARLLLTGILPYSSLRARFSSLAKPSFPLQCFAFSLYRTPLVYIIHAFISQRDVLASIPHLSDLLQISSTFSLIFIFVLGLSLLIVAILSSFQWFVFVFLASCVFPLGAYSAKGPQVTFEIMVITGRKSRVFANKNSHRVEFQIRIRLHSTTFDGTALMRSETDLVLSLSHVFVFFVLPSSQLSVSHTSPSEGQRCSSVSRLEMRPEAHRIFRFRPRPSEQQKGPSPSDCTGTRHATQQDSRPRGSESRRRSGEGAGSAGREEMPRVGPRGSDSPPVPWLWAFRVAVVCGRGPVVTAR